MSYLKKIIPVNRISDVGYESETVILNAGMPIGLLLTLTYSTEIIEESKGLSPISRIEKS